MPVVELQPILSENYRFLQEHVYAQAGIVLEGDKHYLFESRLLPIVTSLGLPSINHLCDMLRDRPGHELGRQVVEAMTTNETYFFREPSHYQAIRKHLLPRLKQLRRDSRTMRFWSAAASTGQEAYSLAMILLEDGFGDWNAQILGTDFSSHVVARARAARYPQIAVNRGLPTSLLIKYFSRVGVDWQLRAEPQRLAQFEQIDLRGDLRPLGTFDLVFCRNVMIYFDPQTRLNLIERIRGCLAPGGWLLLGAAETASGVDRWFDRQSIEGASIFVAR